MTCKDSFKNRFANLKRRCSCKNHKDYKNYGGRGIKNEWKTFEDFKKDMYPSFMIHVKKYKLKQTTLDRMDNNGNYNKTNCRWATSKEQNNNKRQTEHLLEYKGKIQNISQWAIELNISRNSINSRISKNLPIEKILSPFRNKKGTPGKLFEFNNKKQTILDWSKELGIKRITLYSRIKKNYPVDKIFKRIMIKKSDIHTNLF